MFALPSWWHNPKKNGGPKQFITRSVSLGTVPKKEQQACIGFPSYKAKAFKEMDRYEPILLAMFPDLSRYGKLVRVEKKTEYGPECQLRFRFLRKDKTAEEFALFLLENLPDYWPNEHIEWHFVPKTPPKPKIDDDDILNPF